MALSDRDKEILKAMEANLSSSDPKLSSIMVEGGTADYPKNLRFKWNILLVFTGMVAIFTGSIVNSPWIGVLGFLLALYGVQALIHKISIIYRVGYQTGLAKTDGLSKRLGDRWDDRKFDN